MRKKTLRSTLIAGSGALIVVGSSLGMALPAYAIADASSTPAATSTAASTRLDAAKLKLCAVREKVIDNILTRVSDRGNRHLALITDVATKTENFYTKSGKTLDSYDSLVATINSDKATAQSAVDQVKTDSTSFNCDGTDPVGTLKSFKADVTAEVTALQNYKQSVQALIAGVKTVETTTTSGGSQ